MATKTITLTGAEVAVTGLDGSHAHIRNDSTDTIYAAKTAGITAGADGVASIPAGQADTLRGISGAVYLLGTGSALIQSDDYVESPFKASTASGGSAVDDVARAAVSAHAGNADIHVTADEKASWNEINYINPNLLDNSDFKINQAGKSVYSEGEKECLDRWVVQADSTGGITVSPLDSGGVRIENTGINVGIRQVICSGVIAEGESYTMSVEIDGTRYSAILNADKNGSVVPYGETPYYSALVYSSAADIWMAYPYVVYTGEYSVELKNAKLEPGTTATPFIAPNAVFENVKIKCSSDIGEYSGIPADTLDGLHANEIASNPNLLINPDFRINQRAETSYSTAGYTVDCWKLFSTVSGSLGSVAVSDDGVTLTGGDNAMDAYLCQFLEDSYGNKIAGKTVTVSFEVENVTGLGICVAQYGRSESSNLFARVTSDGIYKVTGVWEPLSITNRHALMFYNRDAYSSAKIKWVKLEIGSISSPFCPPDPATEIAKCQRYYQIRSTGDIDPVDLRPSMATIKDIKQRSDGNYEYIAEL